MQDMLEQMEYGIEEIWPATTSRRPSIIASP